MSAIPRDGTEPLSVGDQVQIVPEWQDPGDDKYESFVIEAPANTSQVRIRTIIPDIVFCPTEWIEADKLVLVKPAETPQPLRVTRSIMSTSAPVVALPWPDRAGFWWSRHHWGMELSESFLHKDPDVGDSAYAVRMHNGGGALDAPSFPNDFDHGAVEFIWLGESFDHMLGKV